jgi:hypothetical protein
MIEFRPLTKAEEQRQDHFCRRCETWQKRFEIHHCVATERWKAAKAAGEVVHPSLRPVRKPVNAAKLSERLALPGVRALPPPAKAKAKPNDRTPPPDNQSPWEAAGVSKATYYRKLKSQGVSRETETA